MKVILILFVSAVFVLRCGASEPIPMHPAKSGEIVEDWATGEYPVTPQVLRALGLAPTSTPDDIRAVFAQHGVDITPEGKAQMFRGGAVILVATYTKQHEQIGRLLKSIGQDHHSHERRRPA